METCQARCSSLAGLGRLAKNLLHLTKVICLPIALHLSCSTLLIHLGGAPTPPDHGWKLTQRRGTRIWEPFVQNVCLLGFFWLSYCWGMMGSRTLPPFRIDALLLLQTDRMRLDHNTLAASQEHAHERFSTSQTFSNRGEGTNYTTLLVGYGIFLFFRGLELAPPPWEGGVPVATPRIFEGGEPR